MDEQAQKKRKRDQMQDGDDDEWSDVEGVEAEKPGEGLKKKTLKDTKKQKKIDEELAEQNEK